MQKWRHGRFIRVHPFMMGILNILIPASRALEATKMMGFVPFRSLFSSSQNCYDHTLNDLEIHWILFCQF